MPIERPEPAEALERAVPGAMNGVMDVHRQADHRRRDDPAGTTNAVFPVIAHAIATIGSENDA